MVVCNPAQNRGTRMRSLFKSAWEFVRGVIRKVYLWGSAFILDPGDFYNKMAPPHWWRPPTLPDPWPWVVLAALVFWCAVLTYHELRMKYRVGPRGIDADMRLRDLFKYLMDETAFLISFSDFTDRAEAVRKAVEDQIRMGRIAVWGRQTWADQHRTLGQIGGDYFTGNTIDLLSVLDPDESRPSATWNEEYTDLRVNKEQIEQVWPPLTRSAKWRNSLNQRFRKAEASGTRSQSNTEEKTQQ